MSWGNCQRVPAVLWIVVPPLLYPATFHQEREPRSRGKAVTMQCDGKKLFEPSIFRKQIFVGNWISRLGESGRDQN